MTLMSTVVPIEWWGPATSDDASISGTVAQYVFTAAKEIM